MERLSGNWDDGTGTGEESNWKDCYWDRVMIIKYDSRVW